MTRNLLVGLSATVSVLVGCGGGTQARPGVARAAITVAGNEVSCSTPAAKVFNAGLCLCEDLDLVGSGVTALSSDGLAVNVGVNGTVDVVGEHDINGSLVAWKGVHDTGHLTVRDDLISTGNVDGVGELHVGGDLHVGGNLSTVGQFSVGGLVCVAGTIDSVGSGGTVRPGTYRAPAAPPCGCAKEQLLDVAAEVDRARANVGSSVVRVPVVDGVGELVVELTGGRYYLTGLQSVGHLRLVVKAPSALFVDGDWTTVGQDTIDVDPDASLDLYVKGKIENVGSWKVGTGTLAGVVRLFVGGTDSLVESVGDKDFVGSIYAPTAAMELVGDTRIRGAIFARKLTGTGSLLVDYAQPALPTAAACAGK